MGPSRVTLTTTLHLPYLITTRHQFDPGDRLETRLQSKTRHLLGEEDRRLLTTPNDVEFYPLHSPFTRRDHRPVPTTVKILRTWSQRSSDITNMVPRQGIQSQEPCPSKKEQKKIFLIFLFTTQPSGLLRQKDFSTSTSSTIGESALDDLFLFPHTFTIASV